MNSDRTDTTGNKLDYYSILKRRKRTVSDFISEHNIRSLEDLNAVIEGLKNEYLISAEFTNLAVKALPVVPVSTPEVKEEIPETVAVPALAEPEPDNEQKPKKRTKKEA